MKEQQLTDSIQIHETGHHKNGHYLNGHHQNSHIAKEEEGDADVMLTTMEISSFDDGINKKVLLPGDQVMTRDEGIIYFVSTEHIHNLPVPISNGP